MLTYVDAVLGVACVLLMLYSAWLRWHARPGARTVATSALFLALGSLGSAIVQDETSRVVTWSFIAFSCAVQAITPVKQKS